MTNDDSEISHLLLRAMAEGGASTSVAVSVGGIRVQPEGRCSILPARIEGQLVGGIDRVSTGESKGLGQGARKGLPYHVLK
jgi:hypothetical protein